MHTVTKSYRDLPAAHRQPYHNGHCSLIHGHNFRFDITFQSDELDKNGFVVDVGELESIKYFLVDHFDHTLLLNFTDPALDYLRDKLTGGAAYAKVFTVPNCGMEGLAEWVFDQAGRLVMRERGLRVIEVTCWEDSKNRATYRP